MGSRTLTLDALARIEGECGLVIRLRDDKVVEAKLNVFEPPRLFEAFLRGRHFTEVPDMVARICGICPVAHQITACEAIENAFGTVMPGPLRDLRRLIYYGEWIESHVLHIAFLHAPDFLGYDNAMGMAAADPQIVKNALRLKQIGNELVRVIGGREVHPINIRVGGFHRLPRREELSALTSELSWGVDAAAQMIRWTGALELPEFERDYEFVAVSQSNEYAITDGRILSSKGLNIDVSQYEKRFVEEQVPHSNSLHSLIDGIDAYVCGPLARFHLNQRLLTNRSRTEAAAAGLIGNVRNPFASIVIRAVETLHALEEAQRLIEAYQPPERSSVNVLERAGTGYACTEAPRGLLYHRYAVGADGLIQQARIVPPTAQNLRSMEQDLRLYAESNAALSRPELTKRCEQLIRCYDPCISCSAHSLRVTFSHD